MINKILLYKGARDENKGMGNPFKIYCYLGKTVEVWGYQVEEVHDGCYFRGKGESRRNGKEGIFFPLV